jgi:cyclase
MTYPVRLVLMLSGFAACAVCGPLVHPLGQGLYAYISDNDASCNSVFLVGQDAILVVDTGFDIRAGENLLSAIRAVSKLPVKYIVNTHYHRDHQAANGLIGPQSEVLTTAFTRQRTLDFLKRPPAGTDFRAATITITDAADIYVDDQRVHLEHPGPGHTMGDLVVSFPAQKVMATGDLFLNGSCPAMDRGSVLNWIHTIETMLGSPAEKFVPGHFGIGSRQDLQRFHDYLAALRDQVAAQIAAEASWEQTRQRLDMSRFSDFRQFPNFHATFADNASVLYQELAGKSRGQGPGDRGQ